MPIPDQDDCPHGEYLPAWTSEGWVRQDVVRCKFCGKHMDKREQALDQLAAEALAEMLYPPHPRE